MIWKNEYSEEQYNIKVEGYSALENDCCAYFSSRVSSKIAEVDGSEQLREYLSELRTTGFESDALIVQIQDHHLPKDWEVGECFAEAVLEDEHDAMFPWETAWDKRTPYASLPGADIVGFQNKAEPRFIFGQVKSSSEAHIPPQVINRGKDCLKEQMYNLQHKKSERQQLIQWLLPRVKGTSWEDAFCDALQKYADNDYFMVGILVSGGRAVNTKDLKGICADINHTADDGEVALLGYYLSPDKSKWVALTQGNKVDS